MKEVIRFTASWCQPCKMLSKYLEDVKTDATITVVDIDVQPEVAIEYGVRGVPTLVKKVDGVETGRSVGLKNTKELQEWIDA